MFLQRFRSPASVSLALLLLLGLAGCGSGGGAKKDGGTDLLLVSYAVTKNAYDKILPAFIADWKARTGQTLTIRTSYGGSASQTRAIIDGLEADVANLALAGDIDKLQKMGLIDAGWEKELPYNSNVTNSVVALITRPGNPKGIRTWSDLARPDVQVITANPKTSGGARWNFLALWGSVSPGQRLGHSPEERRQRKRLQHTHLRTRCATLPRKDFRGELRCNADTSLNSSP
ncbi:MAG: extracellular solute-binding protein, partial [Cyanobacteriota bacterium]